ncbi:MAG TPA: (2Fe-2S)-binding protein [Gemmatimonadaceae bacterium]|nr:(2Fe-2S)-binding protein [Gemmatimonadaceae bacterium]
MRIDIDVNGHRHSVDVDPSQTLLEVLRDELGLTGTKYGCGEGRCGACTVLVGSHAVASCTIPAQSAAGQPITTIEGLERDGRLHPVQQAFLDEQAFQCAYCTPGMVMASVALLRANAQPSREDIAHALETNVCRCGTYPRIVAAVRRAAASGGGETPR